MPTEIFDQYIWTKEKKTNIHSKHGVPGLGNFEHHNTQGSTPPSPFHYHTNILEIHCMVKGQRTTLIEDKGCFHSYTYTGNTVFMTFPFEIHGNGESVQLPCEYYAFQIDLSDPGNLLGLNKEYSNSLAKLLLNQNKRQLRFDSSQLAYLRTAFNLIGSLESGSIKTGVQFLTSFLFSLQYLTPVEQEETTEIDEQIRNSIQYLNDHILEVMQIQDLARAAGYSISHYKKKFKHEIGITPSEYIVLQKIEHAKKLLVTTNQSITQIAFSMGFSSSNYFCSVFKKFMDCTPKEYRNKYK